MDVVLAMVLLVLSAPLLGLCAVMIKLGSRGPVFYSQVRVGRQGRLFTIYKLRTMYVDAERGTGAVWAKKGDSRVVPVCRWMRHSHVDELPQLVNVLRGDMSLVGPRPERPEILRELRRHYPYLDRRLAVRPGITGLAQIRNGYDSDVEGFRRKLEADLEYIANRRWSLEFWILFRTFCKFHDRTAR
jgi:lipopolysaccharide/colanic/teichoic acid biosynthesis glycosyltransferase